MQFTLVNRRVFVIVQEFNRVLDRDDVITVLAVDVVEDSGQSRRFPTTKRACHQSDPALQIGNFREAGWKVECREVGDVGGDDPHHDGATAALYEHVHPEAGFSRQAIGDIASALLAKGADGLFIAGNKIGCDVAGVVGGQYRQARYLDGNQLPVNFYLRRTAR